MRLAGIIAAAVLAMGCHREPARLAGPPCRAGWSAAFGPDSAFRLCVPPGYEAGGRDVRAWVREGAEGLSTGIGIRLAAAPDDYNFPRSLEAWNLRRSCVDCSRAESLHVVIDSVGTHAVPSQTAILTGGEHDGPALFASWQVASGQWVLVQGWAASRAGLDTMRAMLRTVRVRGDSTPAARPAT